MVRATYFETDTTTDDTETTRTALRERFQERIDSGRYDELLPETMQRVLRDGAAIRGLDGELGAIRFALAKLLAEETDAGKLARGVARLTSAAVQTMKFGQTLGDTVDASLAEVLQEILTDLDRGNGM